MHPIPSTSLLLLHSNRSVQGLGHFDIKLRWSKFPSTSNQAYAKSFSLGKPILRWRKPVLYKRARNWANCQFTRPRQCNRQEIPVSETQYQQDCNKNSWQFRTSVTALILICERDHESQSRLLPISVLQQFDFLSQSGNRASIPWPWNWAPSRTSGSKRDAWIKLGYFP